MSSPRGMHDMTGWHPLTCAQADVVEKRHSGLREWRVASGLTFPDNVRSGSNVTFREWWFGDQPILREYLVPDQPCKHFGAIDETAMQPATCSRESCDRPVDPAIDPDLCPGHRQQADNLNNGVRR